MGTTLNYKWINTSEATKAIGKNSTASWIIEVKKEALLREQKRKLKQEREKAESKKKK